MDPSRMRIALVSSSYHPHFGGVEEHVRHVAKELQKRGYGVEVWTVDRGDGFIHSMDVRPFPWTPIMIYTRRVRRKSARGVERPPTVVLPASCSCSTRDIWSMLTTFTS